MRTWTLKFSPEKPSFDIKHNLGTTDVIIEVSDRNGWPVPFSYSCLTKDSAHILLKDESIEFCTVNVVTV